MKYQINSLSNPQWVDNYVLHHFVTPVHTQLKVTGDLDRLYNHIDMVSERNRIFVQAAESVGISDIYLEDGRIWVDIPDNGDTLVWMLKA